MAKEWNASLYHQISAPQVSWGKKVLARVSLRGDETVLDADAALAGSPAIFSKLCRAGKSSPSMFPEI